MNEHPASLRDIASDILDVPVSKLVEKPVSGGYSLNKRALIGDGTHWLFMKEVDTTVLDGNGDIELDWLKKDDVCMDIVRRTLPGLVPEWSRLEANGHTLIMPGYPANDGWLWEPPVDNTIREQYIHAVVTATKDLELIELTAEDIETANLHPVMRDELALDEGFDRILQDSSMLGSLKAKYQVMLAIESSHAQRYEQICSLLSDSESLATLANAAKHLSTQPQASFGHGDVRSDNLAYHPATGRLKFVDWNWASLMPRGFGATEFLIDMARRDADVLPWLADANTDLLAATTGYYLRKCLLPPLAPGNTLRQMQAESAAVAYDLYLTATAN